MKTKSLFSILLVQVLAIFLVLPLFAELPGIDCPEESCATYVNEGQNGYTETSCQCPNDMEDITICQSGSFDPDSEGDKCCVMCCPICDYPENNP